MNGHKLRGFVMVAGRMILGIIGGILGLLLSPLVFLIGIVALVFSGGAVGGVIALAVIGAVSALVGVISAIVSRNRPRVGGILMLLCGMVPILTGLVVFASIDATRITGVLAPFFALYFWTFILMFAGLLSLRAKPATASPPLRPSY